MTGPNPSLPNYANPNGVPYFHESHGISPQRAGKMLTSVARSHTKAKGGPRKFSGRGLVRSAGSLFHQGGGKK